jgi:hypothetical protein
MLELSSVKMEKKVTGSRNTTEFEDNDPMDGAIVRESSEGSKILSVNSAAAWKNNRWSKRKELVGLVSMELKNLPSRIV